VDYGVIHGVARLSDHLPLVVRTVEVSLEPPKRLGAPQCIFPENALSDPTLDRWQQSVTAAFDQYAMVEDGLERVASAVRHGCAEVLHRTGKRPEVKCGVVECEESGCVQRLRRALRRCGDPQVKTWLRRELRARVKREEQALIRARIATRSELQVSAPSEWVRQVFGKPWREAMLAVCEEGVQGRVRLGAGMHQPVGDYFMALHARRAVQVVMDPEWRHLSSERVRSNPCAVHGG
jgi:hypothetical protein